MDDRHQRVELLTLPRPDAAYNLARWLSRSPVDPDGIVQGAMQCAFRALDGFRRGDAMAWLLVIVSNCWVSAGRVTRRYGHADLEDAMMGGGPDPEKVAIKAGHQRRLDAMIARLPADLCDALVLREIEDMSYREITEEPGTPIGTVMSRPAWVRAKLRDIVK